MTDLFTPRQRALSLSGVICARAVGRGIHNCTFDPSQRFSQPAGRCPQEPRRGKRED